MAAVVVIVVAIAIAVLGVIGPYVAAVGVIGALVVIVNPGGIGARLRQSPGWWAIPGMRGASRRAAPFAALLLLYSVPAPLAAFGLVHAVSHPSSSPPVAGSGVGGGSPSPAKPSPSGTTSSIFPSITPTIDTPTASPTSSETPTPTPTATPSATPVPTATLQPIPVLTTAPTPTPAATPSPPPPTPPAQNLCGAPNNPWGYNFCGGSGRVNSPPSDFCNYFNCMASFWQQATGYVEECNDGTYSHSGGQKAPCSSHNGNQRPLNP